MPLKMSTWLAIKVVLVLLSVYLAIPYDFCNKRFLPLLDTTISTKWSTTMHPRCTPSKVVFICVLVACLVAIAWLQIGRAYTATSSVNKTYHLAMCGFLMLAYILVLVESLLMHEATIPHYVIAGVICCIVSYITIMSLHNFEQDEKFLWIRSLKIQDVIATVVTLVLVCLFASGWTNKSIFALFEYVSLTFFCSIGILLL